MSTTRYDAIRFAALEEPVYSRGDEPLRDAIAHAIAAAVEVGLRRAGFDDDPTKRLFGRCSQLGQHPSHIWWDGPPTKPTDEATFCDGLPVEPPSEQRLVQRRTTISDDYLPEDDPDHLSWGVAAHEWDDRIEREL